MFSFIDDFLFSICIIYFTFSTKYVIWFPKNIATFKESICLRETKEQINVF